MPVQIDELNINMALDEADQSASSSANAAKGCTKDEDDATDAQSLSPDEIKDLIVELIEKTLAKGHG